MGNRVGDRLGYAVASAGVLLLGATPERLALAVARGLARVVIRFDRRHAGLARRNLDLAFGDALPDREKQRIVRESYAGLAVNAVEFVHAVRRARRGETPIELEVEGAEHVEAVAASGRAAIFVSCHMGNWEFCPIGTARHGVPLHSIATPRRNPLLDRALNDMRESLGQKIVWKSGAFREAARLLRQGHSLGVLADQNQRKGSVFVEFFGERAATTRGPALLALRTGAPILPGAIQRLPGTNRHRLVVTAPIEPERSGDQGEDVARLTQRYTSRLEELIRRAPEQWLWHHRRWRTRPWKEIRTERDTRSIVRALSVGVHGHAVTLEPVVRPWEEMPSAIRTGMPQSPPLRRRASRAEASPQLREALELLRKRESPEASAPPDPSAAR
ncbi:MAG: lysophospholipid acyltransferase family protein [Myxococcota bacterium]